MISLSVSRGLIWMRTYRFRHNEVNKKLSYVALMFFLIAWVIDLGTDADITGLMNVGLMWLTLAAIEGEKATPNSKIQGRSAPLE